MTKTMEHIASGFEWIGVALIVAGFVATIPASVASYRAGGRVAAFEAARQTFGRALLLSLEVLIAADLIRTISVDLTFEGVGTLGILVVVRTILSFSIDVEINGVLPWRAGPIAPPQRSD